MIITVKYSVTVVAYVDADHVFTFVLLHGNLIEQLSSTFRLQVPKPLSTLSIYPSYTRFPYNPLQLIFPNSSSQNDGRGLHCDSHSSSILQHSSVLSHRVANTFIRCKVFASRVAHRMKALNLCSCRQNLWLIWSLHSPEKLHRTLSMATHSVQQLQCI